MCFFPGRAQDGRHADSSKQAAPADNNNLHNNNDKALSGGYTAGPRPGPATVSQKGVGCGKEKKRQ